MKVAELIGLLEHQDSQDEIASIFTCECDTDINILSLRDDSQLSLNKRFVVQKVTLEEGEAVYIGHERWLEELNIS